MLIFVANLPFSLSITKHWRNRNNMQAILRKFEFTTTQIIGFGFFIAIMIGSLLLSLPIASADGQATDFADAMFTATTSVCVTGLTTVSTASHWSVFGKIVILLLIQMGGLGVITFTTVVFLVFRRRITLKNRLLIQDAYNLDTLSGLVKLTIWILKGTLLVEGIGVCFYALKFIPQFGFWDGIWKAAFNSISAFCNAGMDILGDNSLASYRGSILINFTTMALIIVGGIGFPVWEDVIANVKEQIKKGFSISKFFAKIELHTKLVIVISVILIIGGMVLITILEWNNPKTFGLLPWWEKLLSGLFQSVTTRTAGFYTVPQENFTDASSMICILLMFIGGSPSGTAGGVKTITVGMIILSVVSIVKGKKDTEAFGRKISESNVKKGMAVILLSLSILILTLTALCVVENVDFMSMLYEVTSAIATVGLSKSLTPNLSNAGKIIIMIAMYIGRIGPITLALFFNAKHEKKRRYSLPEEKIIVG